MNIPSKKYTIQIQVLAQGGVGLLQTISTACHADVNTKHLLCKSLYPSDCDYM